MGVVNRWPASKTTSAPATRVSLNQTVSQQKWRNSPSKIVRRYCVWIFAFVQHVQSSLTICLEACPLVGCSCPQEPLLPFTIPFIFLFAIFVSASSKMLSNFWLFFVMNFPHPLPCSMYIFRSSFNTDVNYDIVSIFRISPPMSTHKLCLVTRHSKESMSVAAKNAPCAVVILNGFSILSSHKP